jgi:muramoyltetrapeptide carboxypeptidase
MRTFPHLVVSAGRLEAALLIIAPATSPAQAQEGPGADWIRPKALRPGGTIAFVAPAGPAGLPPIRAYANCLQKGGYAVEPDPPETGASA